MEAGIREQDIVRYLGLIEERVKADRTGAQWILKSFADMKQERRSARLTAMTAATVDRQWSGKPGHEWLPARVEEGQAMDRSQLRVEESMSTDLVTIHPDEPMDLVTRLMDWKHVRHVPVEDESGRLVGLVSVVEVLRYVNDRDPNEQEPVPVRSIMNAQPVSLAPEASLTQAISLMIREKTDCLLVVKDDHLVGILTDRDILNFAGELLGIPSDGS